MALMLWYLGVVIVLCCFGLARELRAVNATLKELVIEVRFAGVPK